MNHFKRSTLTKNLTIFILFGPLFVLILEAYNKGLSAFDLSFMESLLYQNTYYIIGLLFALYSVFWIKRFSLFILPLFFLLNIFIGVELFIQSLDKLLLIVNFIYLGASFVFLTFWMDELKDAVYNPLCTPQDIEKRSSYGLVAELTDTNGVSYIGSVTNWDKEGCFVNILNSNTVPKNKVKFSLKLRGMLFCHNARVVSSYDRGVGIKIILDKQVDQEYNWTELYELINDMGFSPKLI
ncbi:MAG: hypothetical protein ACO20H_01395 [Bacteriovoracaceae bacterium]